MPTQWSNFPETSEPIARLFTAVSGVLRQWGRATSAGLLLALASAAPAQEAPLGRWKTIDDASGKPKFQLKRYTTNEDLYKAGLREYQRKKWDNAVTAFDYDAESGMLIERQTVPTLPKEFDGTSAHVRRPEQRAHAPLEHEAVLVLAVVPVQRRGEGARRHQRARGEELARHLQHNCRSRRHGSHPQRNEGIL